MSRAGHHGDVAYVFEDNGFDSAPTDEVFKNFGGNATSETLEGSHEAVRVFNADRRAAQIVRQVFDGAWSVTHEVTEPMWYLSGIFGPPATSGSSAPFTHLYDLDNNNDPNTLRLYLPTEGFGDYEYLTGCAVASVTVDASNPNNPEVTVTGAYAREPQRASTLSPSPPAFDEDTMSNRDADVRLDGGSVGRAQNVSVTLQANTELIGEIGSDVMVDFVPRAFEPEWSFDKIVFTTQSTVDPLNRFKTATQVTGGLQLDNGETGSDRFFIDIDVLDSFPNQWSESGRNDPDADLMEELQEMGEDATVEIESSDSAPPQT